MQCYWSNHGVGILLNERGDRLLVLSNTKRASWVPHALNLNRKWQWWSTAAESDRIGKSPLLPFNSFFSFSISFRLQKKVCEETHRGCVGDSWQRWLYWFACICRKKLNEEEHEADKRRCRVKWREDRKRSAFFMHVDRKWYRSKIPSFTPRLNCVQIWYLMLVGWCGRKPHVCMEVASGRWDQFRCIRIRMCSKSGEA